VSAGDWIAIALGIAAIVWVNWYFFRAEPRAERSAGADLRGDGVDDHHGKSRHD
jgi:hypothetical protein